MSVGHVHKRGSTWGFVVDVPHSLARRCADCKKRYWVESGRSIDRCDCGGDLAEPRIERRQKWHSGFPTRKGAEAAVREFITVIDRGGDPLPQAMTVAAWVTHWQDSDRVRALRESTRRRYEQLTRDWILPRLGQIELRKIRGRHVRDLIEAAGTKMSPASVGQLRSVMSSMMRAALEAELIDTNPVAAVRRPKTDRPDLAVPTADDLRRLMVEATDPPWAVPVMLACTTGLRRGEVLGLRWEDIDLENARLRVRKTLQSVRSTDGTRVLELVEPKTDRSRRTVTLPQLAVKKLRDARREQAERRLMAGGMWVDRGFVCDRGDGAPLHPDSFGKAAKRYMKMAGLDPKTRLHDCRHAVATMMLEQGVHPAVASAVLGHSSVAFTMDTYQHVGDQMTDQAAAALDGAFAAGVSGLN